MPSTLSMAILVLLAGTAASYSQPEASPPGRRRGPPKFTPFEAPPHDFTHDEVAGSYYHGNGLGSNNSLQLHRRGIFEYTGSGCEGIYAQGKGLWDLEADDWVLLQPVMEQEPGDLEHLAKRFFPVRWGERLYLVADSEMIDFCRAVPHEREFHSHGSDRNRSWFFYLRQGDGEKPFEGEPEVPKCFRRYLDSEFDGRVSDLLEPGNVRIDRGREHGVVPGMLLIIESDDFIVESADDQSAICRDRFPKGEPIEIRIGVEAIPFMEYWRLRSEELRTRKPGS